MNDVDWFLLKTLYQEKNITRAAELVHISQPALTYRLQQIEEELQVKIFLRSKKGINFTSEGEQVVNYANRMTIELQKLKDQLLDMSQNVKGKLRIGVSSNFAHYKLPAILKDFTCVYPHIQINLYTGWSTKIISMMENEEVQIGIIRGDYEWKGPKLLINRDPLCLISQDKITFSDLPNLPMINYKTDQNLNELIKDWWQSHFTQPPFISMEVDKLETCKEMVMHGLGYGIIPRYLVHNEENVFLTNLTCVNGQPILRNQWVFYHKSEINLSVVKAFVDFLKDRYQFVE